MKNTSIIIIAFLTACLGYSQDRFANVEITTQKVTENISMLTGRGGNIMIALDEGEVVMIDSQFAPLSEKIKSAIKELTEDSITYLINTHHHGDHTGGNKNFNSKETTIVGHVNVLERLKNDKKDENSLPELTLEEELELKLPSQNCLLIHVHNAHTDGDTFIYFIEENVVHMGDVFFNKRYPYIDLKSSGSIDGYIKAQQRVISTINPDTQIIPGHGPLGTYEDLVLHNQMLVQITDTIKEKISSGNSRDSIIKDSSITAAYDEQGYGDGFINGERLRTTIYDSLMNPS